MATTKANRASDSINAKQSIPVEIKSFLADGFLAIALISDEKRFPSPMPTPKSAMTEIPAPINFAALASIFIFPFLNEPEPREIPTNTCMTKQQKRKLEACKQQA